MVSLQLPLPLEEGSYGCYGMEIMTMGMVWYGMVWYGDGDGEDDEDEDEDEAEDAGRQAGWTVTACYAERLATQTQTQTQRRTGELAERWQGGVE